jgi:hypothetical protein
MNFPSIGPPGRMSVRTAAYCLGTLNPTCSERFTDDANRLTKNGRNGK